MNNAIDSKLNQLHKAAEKDFTNMPMRNVKSFFQHPTPSNFKEAFLSITKMQGQGLRKLIVENNIKTVVEFGTSFGISTIYLADVHRSR